MKHGSPAAVLVTMVHPEVFTSTDDQRPAGRRRSVSVAEASPSVETVMSKAKRAALSLWMLLHAQNCVLGQKCPHAGCQEAKLLHLHLKTCHAVGDAVCPMCYHGCDQSRKLLAHYRRCRQLRLAAKARSPTSGGAAMATTSTGGNSNAAAAHHCLVCSLVARQARTFLLTPSSTSSATTTTAKRGKPGQRTGKQVTYAASTGGDSLSRLYGIAKQLDATTTTTGGVNNDSVSILTSQQRRARSKSEGDMLKCETIVEEPEILQEQLEELRDATLE